MLTQMKENTGITLIETLFAMFIAGIAIFAATLAFPKTEIMVHSADFRAVAIRACQTEMEQIKNTAYASLTDIDPSTDPTYPKAIIFDAGLDIDGIGDTGDDYLGELNTTITPLEVSGNEIGKRVCVECRWRSEQTLDWRSVSLDALIYNN